MNSDVTKTTKDGNRRFEKGKRTALRLLLVSLSSFAFFLLLFIGCRRDRGAKPDVLESANVESRDDGDGASPAVKLLREAAFAYANAKFYEDRGYVLWEYQREGEDSQIVRTRRPLELSFAKPNYVKMRFGGASLFSDGKTIRATIDDPRYAAQLLERPAPLVLTSIREFYPDAIFAAAADTSLPADFSWTSPQLVLLFAKDPLRTLLPRGATAKLLEPAYIQYGPDEKDAVYCDRVSVDADGERVYWLNRATRALARVELPPARLRLREPGATVLALRVEFPGQILAQNPPESTARYEFPPLDPGGETLERFRWEPPEGLDDESLAARRRAFYATERRFEERVAHSLDVDVYCAELRDASSVPIPRRASPKVMRLREVWSVDSLNAPGRPLAISPEEKGDRDSILLVPCEGNAVAAMNYQGRVFSKTSPSAAAGEPISILREGKNEMGGRRYLAFDPASAKIHRLDENFNDLGSILCDPGATSKIADALWIPGDALDSKRAGIVAALVDSSAQGAARRDAVRLFDAQTREIAWEINSVVMPKRIAFEPKTRALWILDAGVPEPGGVARIDVHDGSRLDAPKLRPRETAWDLAVPKRAPNAGAEATALVYDFEQNASYLVGFDAQGDELWRAVLPDRTGPGEATIASGDLNGDGLDEWLVVAGNGRISFFDPMGALLDEYAHGSRLVGATVARWFGVSFLIITDKRRAIAMRVDWKNRGARHEPIFSIR